MSHIDKLDQYLTDLGFHKSRVDGGKTYQGTMEFPELAGQLSAGRRRVTITLCPRERYLSRLDGWGTVIKDLDLRNYENQEATQILVDLFK